MTNIHFITCTNDEFAAIESGTKGFGLWRGKFAIGDKIEFVSDSKRVDGEVSFVTSQEAPCRYSAEALAEGVSIVSFRLSAK